jgi:hypothetical protein
MCVRVLSYAAALFCAITGVARAQPPADIAAALSATSATRHVVSPGEKTFTTQPGKAFRPGTYVLVTSDDPAQPANYMFGRVQKYQGDQLTVLVKILSGKGTHEDWTIQISGPPGLMGHSAGLSYEWSVDKSATNPGIGRVKVNDVTTRATRLFVSDFDTNHQFVGGVLATWDRSTSEVRGLLRIYVPFAPRFFLDYKIKGRRGASDKWSTFVVEYVGQGETISYGDPVSLLFQPNGDKGDPASGSVTLLLAVVATVSVSLLLGILVTRRRNR